MDLADIRQAIDGIDTTLLNGFVGHGYCHRGRQV